MLSRGKIEKIYAKTYYCCKGKNCDAFLIEGTSQNAVHETIQTGN